MKHRTRPTVADIVVAIALVAIICAVALANNI